VAERQDRAQEAPVQRIAAPVIGFPQAGSQRVIPTQATRLPAEEPAPRLPTELGLDSVDERAVLSGGTREIQVTVEAPLRAGLPDEAHPLQTPVPTAADAPALPVDQIVRAARILRQDGRTEMRVHLEPPTLGWVRVRVTASRDALALNIDAERPETQTLLSQALPELQAALTSRGLEVASLTVRVDLDVARPRSDPDRSAERPRRAEPRDRLGPRSRMTSAGPAPRVDLTI